MKAFSNLLCLNLTDLFNNLIPYVDYIQSTGSFFDVLAIDAISLNFEHRGDIAQVFLRPSRVGTNAVNLGRGGDIAQVFLRPSLLNIASFAV